MKECNERYIELYGDLNLEVIRVNLYKQGLNYSESQFSSHYYGELNHDELLDFAFDVMNSFPKLYAKINRRFKLIIIDEYQDTAEKMLRLFFNSIKDGITQLYLYGNSMQQIYQDYSDEMQKVIRQIKQAPDNIVNYRSNKVVIDLLNKLYNSDFRIQRTPAKEKIESSDFQPRAFIVDETKIKTKIDTVTKEQPGSLILYVFNRERFERIGVRGLFNAYSHISRYGFTHKVHASDILLEQDEDKNQDDLMKCLLVVEHVKCYWEKKQFGNMLRLIKSQKSYFSDLLDVKFQSDKIGLYEAWQEVFTNLKSVDFTIKDLLDLLYKKKIISVGFFERIIRDEEYATVLNVEFAEMDELQRNIRSASTQHGVKGESHDSVVFVAENSNNPRVSMYDFFRVWALSPISLDYFEDFITCYKEQISLICPDTDLVRKDKTKSVPLAKKMLECFKKDKYFELLYKGDYEDYVSNSVIKNFDKLFNTKKADNVLQAYKLFYVGCSRARRNLTVIIDRNLVVDFESELKNKLQNTGFTVFDV